MIRRIKSADIIPFYLQFGLHPVQYEYWDGAEGYCPLAAMICAANAGPIAINSTDEEVERALVKKGFEKDYLTGFRRAFDNLHCDLLAFQLTNEYNLGRMDGEVVRLKLKEVFHDL